MKLLMPIEAPRVEQLVWPHGAFDPVVHHLGKTLLSSLEQPITLRRFSSTMSCRPITVMLFALMAV